MRLHQNRLWVVLAAAALVATTGVVIAPVLTQQASADSFTTPGTFFFTVPTGVTSVNVTVTGARGGAGFTGSGGSTLCGNAGTITGGAAGGGAVVSDSSLAVTGGQTLAVVVGSQGTNGTTGSNGTNVSGGAGSGFSNGGAGGAGRVTTGIVSGFNGGGGGGGGAASAIGLPVSGSTAITPLVVAGGGGGGGGPAVRATAVFNLGCSFSNPTGGSGGNAGSAGAAGSPSLGPSPPGANQSGSGGTFPGSSPTGAAGASGATSSFGGASGGGGGAGGGYTFGGNGGSGGGVAFSTVCGTCASGAGGGGAGGQSFAPPGAVVTPSGFNSTGNGSVTITFPTVITTANLTSSPNPSTLGSPVTLSATVTPVEAPGVPSGTVTFFSDGVALGAPVTLNASGVATLTTAALSVGSHAITAVYSGDTTFAGSTSGTLTQVVNPGVAGLALAAPPPPGTSAAAPAIVSASGQAITYTFAVTNTGTLTASSLSLVNTPTPPAGFATFVSCTPTSIPGGATAACTASYTASTADIAGSSGEIVQTFTATGTTTPGSVSSNAFSVSVDVRATQSGWTSSVINTNNTIGVSP